MKKFLALAMVFFTVLAFSACGIYSSGGTSSSLNEIQSVVRATQTAFEGGKYQEAQNGIAKLVELSENSLYSETERLIAQFCATYINSGLMLDYIIKNDKAWLETHNVDEFDVLYGAVFSEVINGGVTHIDTLKGYIQGLVGATREIYMHYNELRGN